ncbi:DUF996 domain-containing protein [Hydrogenobacter hydrogenophilus]|uniref:Uncharacterized membrane protein n=1 Tax=Hydrogenobacter hydrogenophilus TaxID=35835 RepID=A0A285P3Y3_9AQUI|nr:DUF996 domain-containing protein [Hydrogenobacter hydrogenophilus]SNZ15977.1 Uncharacterized membrane protein [Hydrogenobacter hydrogenophilus]
MTQQNGLATEKVNISTQKLLGGIGSLLMLLSFIPVIGILLGILGIVFWLVSMYQISSKIKKPEIFSKAIIGFILALLGWIIALMFGLMSFVSFFASSGFTRDEGQVGLGIGIGIFIALLVDYIISIVAAYFYKEAYKILAVTINHNLFRTAGLLMYIGAITVILFGIGIILWIVGWIILVIAFFTAPDEVEIRA